LLRIEEIYRRMKTAVGHSGPQTALGTGFFQEAPPEMKPAGPVGLANTFAGGFTAQVDGRPPMSSEKNYDGPNVRMDAMYFFTGRLQQFSDQTYPYVIVHELAHFVGEEVTDPNAILDYSYHVRADWKTLNPKKALCTADAYSQLAAEAALGRLYMAYENVVSV
jgi:hypothetical protein